MINKRKILYLILGIEFLLVLYIVLRDNYIINSFTLSKSVQLLIIMILIVISIYLYRYIKRLFNNNKYSYNIVTYMGFLIFIIINIIRHTFLILVNWNLYNKYLIYNNILESFSGFVVFTLPCIVIISIYSIISNIVLMNKEGKRLRNFLGIFIAILAIIGLFGSQIIFMFTSSVFKGNKIFLIKHITDVFINSTLVYLYSILLATIYCNYKVASNKPSYDKDYVIILGCMIDSNGELTPLLKSRVDKAISFARLQKENNGKDIIFIPSGGQGRDEVISEALAIKNYLVKQGIKSKNIILEDKSLNTYQNMKNSYKIIKKKGLGKGCFSTTNYHVFRSWVVVSDIGMDCEGMGSSTKWYFRTNALIREFIADLVKDKYKHLIVLGIIYFFAVLLVLIGYYFQMINFY